MSARMRQLRPDRSPADRLGAEVRRLRCNHHLSQATLGRSVFVSADLIRKIEHAERFPKEDLIHRLDTALRANGTLVDFWREARPTPTVQTAKSPTSHHRMAATRRLRSHMPTARPNSPKSYVWHRRQVVQAAAEDQGRTKKPTAPAGLSTMNILEAGSETNS